MMFNWENARSLMKQLTGGKGCDECPFYHNGFCEKVSKEDEETLCDVVLYKYLINED